LTSCDIQTFDYVSNTGVVKGFQVKIFDEL